MKFGVSTLLFTSPFTNESVELFGMIRELGFDGVEIPLESIGDFDYRRTLGALKDSGLGCCSVCGFFTKDRDLRGSKTEQESSKQYIRACVDACSALECDLLVGPMYSVVGRARMETAEERTEGWRSVVRNLRELCSYAESSGVYLALEPMNRCATDFINTCAQAKQMIQDVGSERLKIHLDTFHMNIEEKSPSMAILDAGKDLFYFHVSENDRGTPGTGSINWKGIKDALVRVEYDRYVVIEAFMPDIPVGGLAASVWRATEKSGIVLARKGLTYLKALFSNA
jgi:D-psicose/D-tagatose/L-ribulose 3-epimerase